MKLTVLNSEQYSQCRSRLSRNSLRSSDSPVCIKKYKIEELIGLIIEIGFFLLLEIEIIKGFFQHRNLEAIA